jgi:hypothetical protein
LVKLFLIITLIDNLLYVNYNFTINLWCFVEIQENMIYVIKKIIDNNKNELTLYVLCFLITRHKLNNLTKRASCKLSKMSKYHLFSC